MLSSLRKLFGQRSIEIPQALWQQELRDLPWLQHWDARQRQALRALCGRFLAQKSMAGVAGLALTAPMQLHIAAQACVPIAQLGLHWYSGWSGIVVYPGSFRVHRHVHEGDGLVQEYDAELSGEAWDGGPVVLSWEDAAPARAGASPAGADNLVIHEFAHKIDLLDGRADGIPPFDPALHAGLRRPQWQHVLEDAYERFCAELDLIDAQLPPGLDPDSDQAARHYTHLPLDPYAGTDPAEFFAVSSEAFFLRPEPLAQAFSAWHELLHRFYRPEDRRH